MKAELTLIPRLTIHPDKIVTFNETHWVPIKPTRNKLQLPIEYYTSQADRIINSSRSAEGLVSKHAKRKMTRALDYLLYMSKPHSQVINPTGKSLQFSIAFITLTLPSKQLHSDNQIKKECLNQILIELKQRHKVNHYVWRAEKQENGNIHFHIIVNKFVNWNELRNRWNRIINKLGYVDEYQKNQKAFHQTGFRYRPELAKNWNYEHQHKAYLTGARNDFRNPNSTDVHSIRKIHNIKNYMIKYMTKNEVKKNEQADQLPEFSKQSGRIWGCDQNLSNIKGAQLTVDSEIETALSKVVSKIKPEIYEGEYFKVYYIDNNQLKLNSPDILFKEFAQYMCAHFDFNTELVT